MAVTVGCMSAAARLLGSRVRTPLRAQVFVSCVGLCCAAIGPCDELTARPEESNLMCVCVCVCVCVTNSV